MIKLIKVNEVFLKVDCSDKVAKELSHFFTFSIPNMMFMRRPGWNGKIKLFNLLGNTIWLGLLKKVEKFLTDSGYSYTYQGFDYVNLYPVENIDLFFDKLNFKHKPRDYQINGAKYIMQNERGILVCPTASGKSLIAAILSAYYAQSKILIITPIISLVKQMRTDFIDYGITEPIHEIMAGKEHDTDDRIVVSTWQSIYGHDRKWFNQFDVVIVDEVHLADASSLKSIMKKLINCRYRIGMTGSLKDTKVHKLVLEGLFGPIVRMTTTEKLIKRGILSQMDIKIFLLKHEEPTAKFNYQSEIEYIEALDKRNRFIVSLVKSLKGNTLVLFSHIDNHATPLLELMKSKMPDIKINYIDGKVAVDDREDIREELEQSEQSILLASYQTFSTGANVKRIHNIVFASPFKSSIRLLQSIGRGLRKYPEKHLTVYDIADDIRFHQRLNYGLKHLDKRIRVYKTEGFPYNIINLDLNKK